MKYAFVAHKGILFLHPPIQINMKRILQLCLSAILLFSANSVFSQDEKEQINQKNDSLQNPVNNLDEIVVVGSRTPNKSKLETAVPIDVVSLAKIKNAPFEG